MESKTQVENHNRQDQNYSELNLNELISKFEANNDQIATEIVVKSQTCLSANQKVKIFRGFNRGINPDGIVYKIIQIDAGQFRYYYQIIKKANTWYKHYQKIYKTYTNILPEVKCFVKKQSQPITSDSIIHLKIVRPYFEGRNFHEQIYIHNSPICYTQDNFGIFIKQSLTILHLDLGSGLLVPTLDNIYFDGSNLNANMLSFQTLRFIQQKSNCLSSQNFKQLYILLTPDQEMFCNPHLMREYLKQRIKIKAFFIMMFCFITLRSPIQMIWDENIQGSDLEWNKIRKVQNNNFIPIQSSQVLKHIRKIHNKWQTLLLRPQNVRCFQIFSTKVIFKDMQKEQRQKNKSYLLQLFLAVFAGDKSKQLFNKIDWKRIGWRELFKQQAIKPIFQLIVKQNQIQYFQRLNQILKRQKEVQVQFMNLVESLRKKYKQKPNRPQTNPQGIPSAQTNQENEKDPNPKQKKSHFSVSQRMRAKVSAVKKAFIYLHKYFVALDIKQMKLNKQKAKQYVKHLNFQTYIPIKLGIPLLITLSYENWFEIFFVQYSDQRGAVFAAAKNIYQIVVKNAAHILQLVKNCELFHLKRIAYLTGTKLKEDQKIDLQHEDTQPQNYRMMLLDNYLPIKSMIEQTRTHKVSKRMYQFSLRSFGDYIKRNKMLMKQYSPFQLYQRIVNDKVLNRQIQKEKQVYTYTYKDYLPLIYIYLKIEGQRTQSSIEGEQKLELKSKSMNEKLKQIQPYIKEVFEVTWSSDQRNSKIMQRYLGEFKQFLRDYYNVQLKFLKLPGEK